MSGITMQQMTGMELIENPMLTVTRTRTKRWRRLNRPDKVRTRSHPVPDTRVFVIQGRKLVAHPAIIRKIKEACVELAEVGFKIRG